MRRSLRVWIIAGVVASAAACLQFSETGRYLCDPSVESCDDGGAIIPGGHGDGGQDGGSGGDGGPTDGGLPVEDYCAQSAQAYCELVVQCGAFSKAYQDDCVSFLQRNCEGTASAVKLGAQAYDPAEAARCLSVASDLLRDGGAKVCQDDDFLADCKALEPNAGFGDACITDSDCVDEGAVCSGPSCQRTCTRDAGELGQGCGMSGCTGSARCDPATDTCVPPLPDGAPCTDSQQCGNELTGYCNFSPNGAVCRTLPGAQQPCDTQHSPSCAPGTYCLQDATAPTCMTYSPEGGNCGQYDACGPDAQCLNGTCVRKADEFEACTNNESCRSDLRCASGKCVSPLLPGASCNPSEQACKDLCDDVTWQCTRVTGVDRGEVCTGRLIVCLGDQDRCKGAQRGTTGPGKTGTCQPIQVGDPCNYDAYGPCAARMYCDYDSVSGKGTCEATSLGSPCSSYPEDQCQSGQFCSAKGVCEPIRKDGQTCSLGDIKPCEVGTCHPDAAGSTNGHCGPLRPVDQECIINEDCEPLLACRNDKCTEVAHIGEPCANGVCFTGTCVFNANFGVCEPLLTDGAACSSSQQCASNACDHGCVESICQ